MTKLELEEENRCLRLNCKNLEAQVQSLQKQLSEEEEYQRRLHAQELKGLENKVAYAQKKQKELWDLWTASEKREKKLESQLRKRNT